MVWKTRMFQPECRSEISDGFWFLWTKEGNLAFSIKIDKIQEMRCQNYGWISTVSTLVRTTDGKEYFIDEDMIPNYFELMCELSELMGWDLGPVTHVQFTTTDYESYLLYWKKKA